MTEKNVINIIASYLRKANDAMGPGRMSVSYSRQLADGLLNQITLADLDAIKELFP